MGNISLGYLEQIHFHNTDESVKENLQNAFTDIRSLEAKIQKEEEIMEHNPLYDQYEAYTSLLEQYQILGGYTYNNEIERVARGIGIFHLLERPIAHVS